jgi:two-component system phosphate regulon sensor histidine kinase PhoR
MFSRLLSFFALQLACGGVAWWLAVGEQRHAVVVLAMLAASYAWGVLDVVQGTRVLIWLKKGELTESSIRMGIWGELAERVRKVARVRERTAIESDSRLQDFLAALQASPNGVVLLDKDARIEWFNQTAAGHFGLDAKRDLLQHFGNLVRDPAFAAYFTARDFSKAVEMPGRFNSSSLPVKLSVHMHPYGEGRCLLLSRDITVLEQVETMRRDFVANVSHEIRTPLTVLAGFIETLQTLTLDPQLQEKYLALMSEQAQRMQSLVNDLLMLSRLEGSPLPSSQDWVPVADLMAQCERDAHALSGLLWPEAHAIHFQAPEGLEVAGSAAELHSAMSNLIGNAIRYSQPDRPIEVQWSQGTGGTVVFSVKDQGVGISPEHIPRLTERFYRVDRSRSRETGGTGLGLAIVKHIAQRHSAELSIESTPGKGSRFCLTFPAARIQLQTPNH